MISVQTITELRSAVKKFTSADVSVPAAVSSSVEASPSAWRRLSSVGLSGTSDCEPVTRSALVDSAVRIIQKNGNRLTNSSSPIAPQAAIRPQLMPRLDADALLPVGAGEFGGGAHARSDSPARSMRIWMAATMTSSTISATASADA